MTSTDFNLLRQKCRAEAQKVAEKYGLWLTGGVYFRPEDERLGFAIGNAVDSAEFRLAWSRHRPAMETAGVTYTSTGKTPAIIWIDHAYLPQK